MTTKLGDTVKVKHIDEVGLVHPPATSPTTQVRLWFGANPVALGVDLPPIAGVQARRLIASSANVEVTGGAS